MSEKNRALPVPAQIAVRCAWLTAYSLAFGFVSQAALAQVESTGTAPQTSAQIKEVTVTAERRTQSLQKVAASVEVVRGSDIEAQGKITTQQILEDVPNLVVNAPANQSLDNPDGNITIRGVESTQQTAGTSAPSTTATYVDDVYQGIGGDFDINRVEVLRGPQGTLYGRSATGGVVAFHTNDPELGKFGGTIMGEYGSADLRQAIVAVNIPVLPQIAVRVAAREYDQHGYYNTIGGSLRNQEARVKALYQPLPNLSFIAAWTIKELHTGAGGITPSLPTPTEFRYTGAYVPPSILESRWHQISLTGKYDFGYGTLTYIGAYHDYALNGSQQTEAPGQVLTNVDGTPLDQIHTEEVRVASDPGSPLTWLAGANFYADQFKTTLGSIENAIDLPDGTPDPTPGATNAVIYNEGSNARIFDYGLFTEETYPVLPNLRLTGGARLDETKVSEFDQLYSNTNIDPYFNPINPPIYAYDSLASSKIFRNFTYKLRAEYDLAPAHMIYAMVSTGFLPGEQQLVENVTHVGFAFVTSFRVLPFTQERLTAYEIGSKNRFLNDTLQINGDVFYEHYAGYQEAASISSFGPPTYALITVPLHIAGAELDALWQFTPNDRFSFSGGLTDVEVQGNPYIGGLGYALKYLALRRLPGVVPAQFTAAYSHTILFPDGSSLIPRAQTRFYGAYDLANLNAAEIGLGERPYMHQAATMVGDVDLDWTSANGKYSVDGYVRNIANNIYKTTVTPDDTGVGDIQFTPSDPRTAGIVLTAKF